MLLTDYTSFIRQTLDAQKLPSPPITEEEFNAGALLFTGIAIESSREYDYAFPEGTPAEDTKVKSFIKKHAHRFWKVCNTGFPFSIIDPVASEELLQKACDYSDAPIADFLFQERFEGMSEQELSSFFKETLKCLNSKAIADSCLYLSYQYEKESNYRAGFYLLWLIKESAGCNFEIPPEKTFDLSTVQAVLSQFILSSKREISSPSTFINILCYRRCHCGAHPYESLLTERALHSFVYFAAKNLSLIPKDKWPEKSAVVLDLAVGLIKKSSPCTLNLLQQKGNLEVKTILQHFLAAHQASSLNEAIPHFNALLDLIPSLNHSGIKNIFRRDFPKLLFQDIQVPGVKKLDYRMNEAFLLGDLILIKQRHHRSRPTPHLLAYDRKTEKMVWGIPLDYSQYKVGQVGKHLILHAEEESNILFVDSSTGKSFPVEISPLTSKTPHICLAKEGYTYQFIIGSPHATIIGGRLTPSGWTRSFELKSQPRALPFSLETHAGIWNPNLKPELTVISPCGAHIKIEQCLSAKAFGNTLFTIEKHPREEDKCLLRMRALKNNKNVVSDPYDIEIDSSKASLIHVCDNGTCILSDKSSSGYWYPIFVNLETKEVSYSSNSILSLGKIGINPHKGEIFSWNEYDRELWKTSSKEATLITGLEYAGSTDAEHGGRFLHDGKHLYIE